MDWVKVDLLHLTAWYSNHMNLAITPSDTYAPPNQDINHELWRILTHRCYHNEEENYYSISAPERRRS